MRRPSSPFLLFASLLALSCDHRAPAPGLVEHASFGVFFGGQIQERDEIPFTLDRAKLRQGFRIDFASRSSSPW